MDREVIKDMIMGTSMSLALFLAILSIPVFGLAVGLYAPLPIAYYSRKLGRYRGALIAVAVFSILCVVGEITIGVLYAVEFAVMGIVLSEASRTQLSLGKGVLAAALVSVAGSVLLLIFLVKPVDKGYPEALEEYVGRNVTETVEASKKMGFSAEEAETIEDVARTVKKVIVKTFPALVFIGALSAALLNLLALKGLLKRGGLEEYGVAPERWQAPEIIVWVLITGGGLMLLKDQAANDVGLNLVFVSGAIYLFQGMAIAGFYFDRFQLPRFLRVTGFVLILFQQVLTLVVIGFGLFDLWFDFRRLKKGGVDAGHIN